MRPLIALPLLATLAIAGVAPAADTALLGFQTDRSAAQRELERKFDASLDAGEMTGWLKRMAAGPNQVGAPHNKENADFVLAQFKEWGWDARIETFQVLYPTPKTVSLELLAPVAYKALLRETPVPGDATSEQTEHVLPPYVIYGADGDVTGELVYVNYGMPDDYRVLEARGISVKGKIVIARYGAGWRGLKPKLAWQHGAIGTIIYSDPADDGFATDDAYPAGPSRPPQGVQRGSVQDIPVRSGDPLTPNVGATKDAKRLTRDQAETLLKIPVLPISYGDAQQLLSQLGGPVVPANWRGALPLTYHFGGGPAKARLVVQSDWSLKPIYNVIATLKGAEFPDQWVIRGNHRDGWVFGASDPLSGHVPLMAEAKALGMLAKAGWKPRRTLVYCSWDGEEPGLLGSTEWAEEHAAELQKKAVLYLNSDGNQRGFLRGQGTHSLQRIVNEAGAAVTDPQTRVSAQERWRARVRTAGLERGANEEARTAAENAAKGGDLAIFPAGSGSDYTPFLQHLGIASVDIGYGGEGEGAGVYHSAYDTFEHYTRFGDPGLAYGVALAATAGRIMLRAAEGDLLPYQFGGFADTVGRYVAELHGMVDAQRKRSDALEEALKAGIYRLAADPTETHVAPPSEGATPVLEFAALDNALAHLKKAATAYDQAANAALSKGTPTAAAKVNALLQNLEQTLLDPAGLPGRPWYRHLVYAPGLATGYAAKTLPGVREAVEDRRWDEANREIAATAKALAAYAARLDAATELLTGTPDKAAQTQTGKS